MTLKELLEGDPAYRTLTGRVHARKRKWQMLHCVLELRRGGSVAPVQLTAERFGVTRQAVHKALRTLR